MSPITFSFLLTNAYFPIKEKKDTTFVVISNVVKGLGYIPVIGAIATIAYTAFILGSADKWNKEEYAFLAFSCLRVTLNLTMPFILPIIDIAATCLVLRKIKEEAIAKQ